MKKFYVIIASLFILNISVAQELLHSFPEAARQNSTLNLTIHSINTHFNSSDSNLVIITNNINTYKKWVPNTYDNDIFLNAYFQTAPNTTGYYDMYLYNNIDDTIYLKNALYISEFVIKRNLDSPYYYSNNVTSSISISETNSHFISGGNQTAYLVNNENDTLNVDNINAPTEDSLIITFTPDTSKHGIYNLFTYNDMDSIAYAANIINIKNNAYTQIDSVSPDTLLTYDLDNKFVVYGHKTHFTQDSCAVYLDMDFQLPLYNINIINDSLLTFMVNIPIVVKGIKPETMMFYVHNSIDGRMAFITKLYLGGSINSSIKNTNIKLYPNPINGKKFTLEFDEITTQNSTLNIFNEIGQELKSEQLNDGIKSKSIDVSSLSSGIYFYSIITKEGQINAGKFIIK